VQLYLTSILDDDFISSYNLLSSKQQLRCPLTTMATQSGNKEVLRQTHVTLKKTEIIDVNAFVTVKITTIDNNGLFGTSENSHEERYSLVKEDGQWRINGDVWPNLDCLSPTTHIQSN
jgi:hypothetical protein